MDTWLRWLVAATCCVIVAAGGYFVWNDHQDRVAEEARRQQIAMQYMCNGMLADLKTGKKSQDWRILHVAKCVAGNYLSEGDFSTYELKDVLKRARPSIEVERESLSQ